MPNQDIYRRCNLLCAAGLSLLLAACGSAPPRQEPIDAPGVEATAPTVADAVLLGQLLLPPQAALPAAARVRFTLIDRFPNEPDPLPLAQREQPLDGGSPFAFELPFARAAVRDATVYRLDVAVYDAAGRLRFVSDGEHPVNLGAEADPTRIELIAIDPQRTGPLSFDCGELQFNATIADPDLLLQLPAGGRQLRRAHAARGLRYVGHHTELWIDGDTAQLQLEAQTHRCRRGAGAVTP